MSKFLDELKTVEVNDSNFRVIDSPFHYESDLLKRVVTVPIGFVTDFASFLPLNGVAHEPAVIHDWLYFSAEETRAKADAVFLEAMKLIGVPLWLRFSMWLGVRAAGWLAWNDHRKAKDENRAQEISAILKV